MLDPDGDGILDGVRRGAYALVDRTRPLRVVSGAEVHVIREAARQFRYENIAARVVLMPRFSRFGEQHGRSKAAIFAYGMPAMTRQAGATKGCFPYIGRDGIAIGIDCFGGSAPGTVALKSLGISPEHVRAAANARGGWGVPSADAWQQGGRPVA